MSWRILNSSRAALGLLLTAALSMAPACFTARPAYVDVAYAPANYAAYPNYVYDGAPVYLIDGRWYRHDHGRWVYYRNEPRQLYRYRNHVVAPPARGRVYSAPHRDNHYTAPRVYSAPRHDNHYSAPRVYNAPRREERRDRAPSRDTHQYRAAPSRDNNHHGAPSRDERRRRD